MTIPELLKLNPQHLAELSSFFAGIEFDDTFEYVDIAAKEFSKNQFEDATFGFDMEFKKLKFDGAFRGKDHTHCVFCGDEDDTFYVLSYAKVDGGEEKIIFKLRKNYDKYKNRK